MAIYREVRTAVWCDICGKQIAAYRGRTGGVSKDWAAYFARQEGCTTGKRIICKECRIKSRIAKCSIQKKWGEANRDGNGTCLGYSREADDEPIEQCKRCIAYTSFDWEEEKQRLNKEMRKQRTGTS